MAPLTKRIMEVRRFGLSNVEIAQRLVVHKSTVDRYVAELDKLSLDEYALLWGLVHDDGEFFYKTFKMGGLP